MVRTLKSVHSESTYFLWYAQLPMLCPLKLIRNLEVDTKFSKLNLKVFKEVEESVS